MLEFYRHIVPKARKPHSCECCGKKIEVGEKYSYTSGKFEGDFFTRELCLVCAGILNKFSLESSEETFDWWEVDDWLKEKYCNDCKHGIPNDDDCESSSCAQCPKIRKEFE